MMLHKLQFPALKCVFLAAFTIIYLTLPVKAQEVNYSFANVQSTNAGPFGSIEFDVTISSSSEFVLGSGQLYLNYNPAAFGENALSTGNIVVTVPPDQDYLLDQRDNMMKSFPVYLQPLELNNNTYSRISIAFRQSVNGGLIDPNVGEKPRKLFHVQFNYAKARFTGSDGICFEQNVSFKNQTFTACGSFNSGSPGGADCKSFPGTRIQTETFDCNPRPSSVPIVQTDGPYTIALFPIPAKNFVQVQFNSADTRLINLKLWDQQGRLAMISEQSLVKGENSWEMDISFLPAGVYYLEFVGDQINATKKFVVIE